MIVVIADDLTGAAEIGGLCLQYELTVEISVTVDLHSKADVLIISTDTRSMEKQQAVDEMAKVTILVRQIRPEMIFKKVDSVLRGHIIDELMVQLERLGMNRALLVPANPALGRIIINGIYYVHGQPVHLMSFSDDPEFPVTDAQVLNMLGGNHSFVQVKKNDEEMPESGIIVGEATTSDDLKQWAERVDKKNTLVAGSSGFFSAILETMDLQKNLNDKANETKLGDPCLFVSGTTYYKSRQAIKKIKTMGGPVSYMPVSIVQSHNPPIEYYQAWSKELIALMATMGKAIIAIDETTTQNSQVSAKDLREKTARIVMEVLQNMHVSELIIEGGATAFSIIKKQGFSQLLPVKEYATGVIRMRVNGQDNLYLTMKPGSYDWPMEIKEFFK